MKVCPKCGWNPVDDTDDNEICANCFTLLVDTDEY